MARIKLPVRFIDQLRLAKMILKRHKKLGDKSPLKNAFDMTSFEDKSNKADVHNDAKDEHEKLAEKETELRDNEWGGAVTVIRSSSQFLKALYHDNPHELGEWGFVVDDTTKSKKEEE